MNFVFLKTPSLERHDYPHPDCHANHVGAALDAYSPCRRQSRALIDRDRLEAGQRHGDSRTCRWAANKTPKMNRNICGRKAHDVGIFWEPIIHGQFPTPLVIPRSTATDIWSFEIMVPIQTTMLLVGLVQLLGAGLFLYLVAGTSR